MEEFYTMSVKELAGKVRDGSISSVDLVDAHIRRIEEVNPYLNAVISNRFEQAREEARQADEERKSGRELPPLHGIPCTIKDALSVKDMPFVGGVWARRNRTGEFDATVVERLRKAGAIVLGKTNVPEASMWCETYNTVFGRTKNPHDTSRTCGGSSGGEGAIVGAGASPFGLGADIGGSIRYPSAFCGVPGHKHTGTLVPGTGHWPPAEGELARYNTYGPLCRKVEDLDYIMPLLIGPDGKDPVTVEHEWTPMQSVDTGSMKAFFFDYNGESRPNPEVRRAVSMAAGALASQGMPVEYWRPEGMENSLAIWQAGLSQNPDPLAKSLGDGERVQLRKELLKFIVRQSKLTLPGLGAALIEKPGQLLKKRNQKFLEQAGRMRELIEEKLGDNGVLICPVFPVPAPRHTRIWLDLMGVGYSGVINIMGFPATIIPIYHRQDGVPVSVQVVAKRFGDHLALAAAKKLEDIFGGWKFPAKIK